MTSGIPAPIAAHPHGTYKGCYRDNFHLHRGRRYVYDDRIRRGRGGGLRINRVSVVHHGTRLWWRNNTCAKRCSG
jgi:hypothetical protein